MVGTLLRPSAVRAHLIRLIFNVVFGPRRLIVPTMDQPWFRNLFGRPRKHRLESAQTEADNGDAEAQFSLGSRFAIGVGMAPDYEQAAQWYLRAARQNHALAQLALGKMFAGGQGVTRDDAEALLWICRAAEQGHAEAQHNLGLRHRRASFKGAPQNTAESNLEAYKWFCLAASQGYKGSDAQCESLALGMTREQVIEGNERVAAFISASLKVVQL